MNICQPDIFERAVQDPCSDAIDKQDISQQYHHHEGIPLFVDVHSHMKQDMLRKVQTAPHYYDKMYHSRSDNAAALQQQKQSSFLRKTRTRTNSCAFIHQSARRSSFLTTARKTSSMVAINDGSSVFSAENNNEQNTVPLPLSRQSSVYAIPSHIYGLEKYVNCELDELSVCPDTDCNSNSNLDLDSMANISQTDSSILDNGYISSPISSESSGVDILSIPSNMKHHFHHHIALPIFNHHSSGRIQQEQQEHSIINSNSNIPRSASTIATNYNAHALNESDRERSSIKISLANSFSS